MKLFRKIIFWLHLVAGIAVGIEIAMLAATGLVMAFEHPLVRWAEAYDGHAAKPNAPLLTVEELLDRAAKLNPDAAPTAMTVSADDNQPVAVQFGRDSQVFLNGFTGDKLGDGATGLRSFFRTVLSLHRWLALSGDYRDVGGNIVGIATIGFLILVVSGLWLWMPRKWRWKSIKPVLLLNVRLKGKPRDWNWHNVLGFWALIPLLFITLTGVTMKYQWAQGLLYRAVGEAPPAPRNVGGGGGGGREGGRGMEARGNREGGRDGSREAGRDANRDGGMRAMQQPLNTEGLNDLWNAATAAADPNWTTVTLRLSGRRGEGGGTDSSDGDTARGISFTFVNGDPNLRYNQATYTFNRRTGELTGSQKFTDQTLGRRLRTLLLPIHRGEILGLPGMAIAAVACLAALVLVYTGFALSYRRLGRPVVAKVRTALRIPRRGQLDDTVRGDPAVAAEG